MVFEIQEGDSTLVSRITFAGNQAFSEGRLREAISTREQAFWRFLSNADEYSPDRANFDRELLRRYYLKNGYADVEVADPRAQLAPDRKSFFMTFTIKEGERYKVGKIEVQSKLRNLAPDLLQPFTELDPNDWYDGDAVDRSTEKMADFAQAHGYPFAEVRPQVRRNAEAHTVDLIFEAIDGPRVYIDRIEIAGNTRTKDRVIRRELRMAEGDAYSPDAIRRNRTRLTDLGYFDNVQINPVQSPGAADRVNLNLEVAEKATGDVTVGGGFSTDVGALVSAGLHERNLVGTGIDAGINGVLAQKQSQISLSVTDPYFLDRNLVAGVELFRIQDNNQDIARYNEKRTGISLRLGYEYNEHFRQSWTYTLVQRNVYAVNTGASIYVQDMAGNSLLSQISQLFTIDYRDSVLEPHRGFVVRVGTDFAGVGGDARYFRGKLDGQYLLPLDWISGNSDYTLVIGGSTGYLGQLGVKEKIIDRFFLGGENLRGFLSGGVGPHDQTTGDSLGGRFIWTQSTEVRFPLPLPADLGLSGRAFVDIGSLSQSSKSLAGSPVFEDTAPRMSAGVGVSWKSPFGVINIDLGKALIKKRFDQTQIFRFGFGTGF